jgi:hypothetical protein
MASPGIGDHAHARAIFTIDAGGLFVGGQGQRLAHELLGACELLGVDALGDVDDEHHRLAADR